MRRGWFVTVLVLLTLGAGVVVGWSMWRDGGEYGHDLEQYDDRTGEPSVYVNLPDGDAQLALGSPDGHRLVVQWRDPDGHGWTSPETVWDDPDMRAIENTVRYGGGTVAIVETYTDDVHDDSDIGNLQVAVVCRDRTCDAHAGSSTEAQVTPDGATAYLGQSRKGVLLWSTGRGFGTEPWRGHPGFDLHRTSPSEPVLAPNGSLRIVSSTPSRDSCTFALLTSAPGSADLTMRARHTEPIRGRSLSDCRTYLATWGDSWVQVNAEDHRATTFWFVGDSSGPWRATARDASGLAPVDVDRGCCDTSIAGFVHWNDIAFGSPDGRRIQVQSHLLGQQHWSEATVLDVAPARSGCRWMDGTEVGPEGYAVLMGCRDGLAVAASPELETWESAYLRGVEGEPIGDDDGLRVGDRLIWTPARGFAA